MGMFYLRAEQHRFIAVGAMGMTLRGHRFHRDTRLRVLMLHQFRIAADRPALVLLVRHKAAAFMLVQLIMVAYAHLFHRIAIRAMGVYTRASLLAAGKHLRHRIAGCLVLMRTRAGFHAAGNAGGIAVRSMGMAALAFFHTADNALAGGIAFIAMGMTSSFFPGAAQLAPAGVAALPMGVPGGFLAAAIQLLRMGIASLTMGMAGRLLGGAGQRSACGVAISIMFVGFVRTGQAGSFRITSVPVGMGALALGCAAAQGSLGDIAAFAMAVGAFALGLAAAQLADVLIAAFPMAVGFRLSLRAGQAALGLLACFCVRMTRILLHRAGQHSSIAFLGVNVSLVFLQAAGRFLCGHLGIAFSNVLVTLSFLRFADQRADLLIAAGAVIPLDLLLQRADQVSFGIHAHLVMPVEILGGLAAAQLMLVVVAFAGMLMGLEGAHQADVFNRRCLPFLLGAEQVGGVARLRVLMGFHAALRITLHGDARQHQSIGRRQRHHHRKTGHDPVSHFSLFRLSDILFCPSAGCSSHSNQHLLCIPSAAAHYN